LNDKPLVAHEIQTIQYQLRLHPRIKATLEILCERSMRSMTSLCLYLLDRSFSSVPVKNAFATLDKADRLLRPNTLRLSPSLHSAIGLAAAAANRSMNSEINARVYDQAVDALASPCFNRRVAESEWLILQHLSETQRETLRRRATEKSMDIFEYSASLLADMLSTSPGSDHPIDR